MTRLRRTLHTVAGGVTLALAALGCGQDRAHDESAPEAAVALNTVPPGLVWRDYQGVAVPAGDDGPASTDVAAATGFTRTPAGAALAAITHTVHLSLAPDQHWVAVAEHEIAYGPGKDEWVTSRALLSITTGADPAQAPRIRGYTVADYTLDRARVDIYTSYPDTSLAINITVVVWQDGDWRLLLPAPGATDPVVYATTTLDAAVPLEAPR